MKLVNLTPHALTLRAADADHTIAPSGVVARVTTTPGPLVERPGIPVPVAGPDVFGEVTGLPAPEAGVVYIVSGVVGAALSGSGRTDVLVPGTAPADEPVRNDKGHIVAVTRLKAVC